MGFPPPPAGPDPSLPVPAAPPGFGPSVGAGVTTPPTAAQLCGFKFPPTVFFKFGFVLPPLPFQFPPPLPKVHVGLALNCDLSNPLSVSAGVSFGGGRASNAPADPDLDDST